MFCFDLLYYFSYFFLLLLFHVHFVAFSIRTCLRHDCEIVLNCLFVAAAAASETSVIIGAVGAVAAASFYNLRRHPLRFPYFSFYRHTKIDNYISKSDRKRSCQRRIYALTLYVLHFNHLRIIIYVRSTHRPTGARIKGQFIMCI